MQALQGSSLSFFAQKLKTEYQNIFLGVQSMGCRGAGMPEDGSHMQQD
jgi:hypothetical protein